MKKESTEGELSASEALYAFGGWLTVRDEPLTLSARHNAAPMAERIGEFCTAYGLAPPRDGWDQKIRKMPGGFQGFSYADMVEAEGK